MPQDIVFPPVLDGKTRSYAYVDVELQKTTRAAVPFTKTAEPVGMDVDGDVVMVTQNGRVIGQIYAENLVSLIKEWKKRGDPIVSILTSYAWTGASGKIAFALYRDDLTRFRKRPDAIIARIGKPDSRLEESDIGSPLGVFLDEDSGRYTLTLNGLEIGLLPIPAVEQIHANSLEPEDAVYLLDHCAKDLDLDRIDWYVIIV